VGEAPEAGQQFQRGEQDDETDRQMDQQRMEAAEKQNDVGRGVQARIPVTGVAWASVPVSFWSRPWKL
jgi:hypothetical protein